MTQQRNVPFVIGPEEADRACLLIHGFSGTPAEMRSLGEALAVQGIRVYGMLVAGHSGNPEDLISTSHKQWLASAESALAQLARYQTVFVCGLSMGGALSLLLASRHPVSIAGVITLSNLTRVYAEGWQGRILFLLPLVRHFMKWFYPLEHLNFNSPKVQAEVLKQARTRDPNVTIDFANPQVVAHIKQMVRIPIAAIAELIHLTREERRQLRKVHTPLLIIHSKRDQTVPPDRAEELYRLAAHAHPKSLHWLETSDHVITVGREEVYRLIIEFIDTIAHSAAKISRPEHVQTEEVDGTHPGH